MFKILVSDITHHPDNENIYQLSDIDDLISSIEDVGLLQPLVIDQHNQVISGNRRLKAILNLNWNEVSVERQVVDNEDIGKFLVHYNKFRNKTYREILNEYHVLEKYYRGSVGRPKKDVPQNKKFSGRDLISKELNLSSSQLGKMLIIEKEDPSLIDLIDKDILTVSQCYLQVSRIRKERESRSNQPNPSSISHPNSPNFTFIKKSSSDMSEIQVGEVQMVFTSPPYWNKRMYDNSEGWLGNESSPDSYVNNLIDHFKDTRRVLSDQGSFFLNIGDTFKDGNLQNIPYKVVMGLQEEGWILRNQIVWRKTNPKPSSSKSNLTPSWEPIFHLVKSMNYHYKHTLGPMSSNTKPSLPPRHRSTKERDPSITSISPYIPREGKNIGDYFDESIVESAVANQPRQEGKEHPAPFPSKIVVLPLLQTTNEGDLVLDPFHGSGTTGKVSNTYGRRYIGYDLKEY